VNIVDDGNDFSADELAHLAAGANEVALKKWRKRIEAAYQSSREHFLKISEIDEAGNSDNLAKKWAERPNLPKGAIRSTVMVLGEEMVKSEPDGKTFVAWLELSHGTSLEKQTFGRAEIIRWLSESGWQSQYRFDFMPDLPPLEANNRVTPHAAFITPLGTTEIGGDARAKNKRPKTIEFENAVLVAMTKVWNQWKSNSASDPTLKEPTKGEMHGAALNELLEKGIKSSNKKPTLQMVSDAAKPWKKPGPMPVAVSPSVAPKKRHPFKAEK
jgi:hypothetical protein